MRSLAGVEFSSYTDSVSQALDAVDARARFRRLSAVLIKPNLVTTSAHPVTTASQCCAALITYIRSCSHADIVIGEGTGDPTCQTRDVFDLLGYGKLSSQYGVGLVDLNEAPVRRLTNTHCRLFPEIYLPEIVFTHYVVSVPVLKAHTLAGMTGTLKNMVGLAPPAYYRRGSGGWKKSFFHTDIHRAIKELNSYRTSDLSLVDASVGLADFHLGGRRCEPPVGKILAGSDPVAVDRMGAELLGLDWESIPYLQGTR